ncbi:sugar ABC transporter substrate-binding protein [Vallitalea pronyensis]|uniref:Sugar ABC transporter substrate-binding protein n=1 Tax=Vallitalea pronyensis TaxID=1348613 RepID=A0A8J8SGA8_9FIRM|nr:sugar ABC transporter substrate-binding protein [Vallitalea pronyensis]QUI22570.1 sugar ABC transporter substrate-binding protein [Vallitalea pronyensis]
MRKKLSIVIVCMLLLSWVLAGCDSTSTKESKPSTQDGDKEKEAITIGFVPMTLNNEYFITMVNGAKQKAEELGIQLDVQAADQHASAAAQLTIVENMITSGVDGICIVPSSSEGLSTALKKCKEAGIPVINLDTKISQSILDEAGLEVAFYGTDNYAGAKSAGEFVVANIAKGVETAILTGIEGQQNAADRRNGFFDAAGSHVKVVAEQSANWEVDQGYTATQNILSANPNIGLIFASNDGMAIGALRAVEEAGKQDAINIIGFDAISEALNMVEAGDMYGTVAQYPAEMGILGVDNMVKMIKGQESESYIDTGAKLITSENVEEHKKYCEQFAD